MTRRCSEARTQPTYERARALGTIAAHIPLVCGALILGACTRAQAPAPHSAHEASAPAVVSELGQLTVVPTSELHTPVSETPVRASDGTRSEQRESPSRSSALVDRAMTELLPDLRHCYDLASKGSPMQGGKMKVSVAVEPSGLVRRVHTVENTTGSAGVARCIEGRIRRMRVGPDPDGRASSCVYPLVFQDAASRR